MSALSQTRRFSDVRATSVLIATNPLFTSHCLGSATDYCLASVWELVEGLLHQTPPASLLFYFTLAVSSSRGASAKGTRIAESGRHNIVVHRPHFGPSHAGRASMLCSVPIRVGERWRCQSRAMPKAATFT